MVFLFGAVCYVSVLWIPFGDNNTASLLGIASVQFSAFVSLVILFDDKSNDRVTTILSDFLRWPRVISLAVIVFCSTLTMAFYFEPVEVLQKKTIGAGLTYLGFFPRFATVFLGKPWIITIQDMQIGVMFCKNTLIGTIAEIYLIRYFFRQIAKGFASTFGFLLITFPGWFFTTYIACSLYITTVSFVGVRSKNGLFLAIGFLIAFLLQFGPELLIVAQDFSGSKGLKAFTAAAAEKAKALAESKQAEGLKKAAGELIDKTRNAAMLTQTQQAYQKALALLQQKIAAIYPNDLVKQSEALTNFTRDVDTSSVKSLRKAIEYIQNMK